MFEWEKQLQQHSLARRVDQLEEDTTRGMNFLSLKVQYAEPSRTFAGMIVYADGTSWNPGSGEGFYRRNKDNSGWAYVIRGSRTFYESNAAYTSTYDIDGVGGTAAGLASYKAKATLVVAAGVGSGATPTTPIKGDEVFFTNNSNYAVVLVNDGTYSTNGDASWAEPGRILHGDWVLDGSITAGKLTVSQLSAIAANLGTVTAGNITGTANIDIAGSAKFSGATSVAGTNAAVVANPGATQPYGLYVLGGGNTGEAVYAIVSGSSATALHGEATGASGVALLGVATGASGRAIRGQMPNATYTALEINAKFKWGDYTYSTPSGDTSEFLRGDGNWQDLGKAVMYVDGSSPSNTATPAGWAKFSSQDGTVTAWFPAYL